VSKYHTCIGVYLSIICDYIQSLLFSKIITCIICSYHVCVMFVLVLHLCHIMGLVYKEDGRNLIYLHVIKGWERCAITIAAAVLLLQ